VCVCVKPNLTRLGGCSADAYTGYSPLHVSLALSIFFVYLSDQTTRVNPYICIYIRMHLHTLSALPTPALSQARWATLLTYVYVYVYIHTYVKKSIYMYICVYIYICIFIH